MSFDVFVGDFKINFHDNFSYVQNPVQQGAISGGANNSSAASYGALNNIIGFRADWDLNKLVASFGYDHVNNINISTGNNYDYIDFASEIVFARASVYIRPEISGGLETTASTTDYTQSIRPDGQQFSVGPFVNWQVGEHLSVTVRGGYVYSQFDRAISLNSSSWNPYGSISLQNSLNKYISQTLTAGYGTTLGIESLSTTGTTVSYTAVWQILRSTSINTGLFYEIADDAGIVLASGQLPENYTRFGATIGTGYQITSKLSSGLSYNYTKKNSDRASRDYAQTVLSLSLNYRF